MNKTAMMVSLGIKVLNEARQIKETLEFRDLLDQQAQEQCTSGDNNRWVLRVPFGSVIREHEQANLVV